MKVKDLIEALKTFDQEKMVVINGYEGGIETVREVRNLSIIVNENLGDSYMGEHGKARDNEEGATEVVYIPRRT